MKDNKRSVLKIFIIISIFIIMICFISSKSVIYAKDSESPKLTQREYSEEYKKWLELSDEEKEKTIMPSPYEIQYNNSLTKKVYNAVKASTLESYYSLKDTGEVTPVRDQKSLGICWSFASIASLESNLLKKNNVNKDLSEIHMLYGTSNQLTPNNTKGYNINANTGGNYYLAESYFTNGLGAVNEASMPFTTSLPQKSNSEIESIKPVTRVEDTAYLITTESIKNHIKENGAVVAEIRVSEDYKTYPYYNSRYKSFCYKGEEASDHAVAIVGWNDNFSKYNFNSNCQPNHDGAWIIKNSWGKDVGEDGYFYVSYEDSVISRYEKYGIVNATTSINYDHLYQYDEVSSFIDWGYDNWNKVYMANVFNKSSQIELLKEVSIKIWNEYNCKIYINSKNGNKGKNDLIQVKEVNSLKPGFHTIKLDKPIALTGTQFVIAVEYDVPTGTSYGGAYVPVEKNVEDNIFATTARCNAGESYITADLNSEWVDLKVVEANATIKAYTTDAPGLEIVKINSIQSSSNPLYNKIGGQITVNVKTTNTADNTKLGLRILKGTENVTSQFTGTSVESTVNNNACTFTVKVPQNFSGSGIYTIEVTNGELGKATQNFTITNLDYTLSAPQITNPTGGNWTNQPFSLIISSGANEQYVDHYEYSYDQETWYKYGTLQTVDGGVQTTPFSTQRNQLVYIKAIDKANRESPISSTMIRIDTTLPQITKVEVANNNKITIVAEDILGNNVRSEIKSYIVTETSDEPSASSNGWKNAPNSSTWTTEESYSTGKKYYIRVKDNAGNISSYKELTIKKIITVPVKETGLRYDGEEKIGVKEGDGYTLTDNKKTDAGTYTAVAKLSNPDISEWSTGGTADKQIEWTIERARGARASTVDKRYTGSEIIGVTGENVTWTGNTKGTMVKEYKAKATPNSNYAWSDGSTTEKEFLWYIYYEVTYTKESNVIEIGESEEYSKTGTITLPTITVAAGYTGKWYNGSTEIGTPGQKNQINDNITLTAKRVAKEYTANFNSNGGTNANPATITKQYGAKLGTLPTTSKEGYIFKGWFTAQTGGSQITADTTMP
ncbi:MAG: InlB B-repeat-containing protein, partial [Clostridia bacterium]|nr:InlB B-repeat-containing protein [Clostridia bacterium]